MVYRQVRLGSMVLEKQGFRSPVYARTGGQCPLALGPSVS